MRLLGAIAGNSELATGYEVEEEGVEIKPSGEVEVISESTAGDDVLQECGRDGKLGFGGEESRGRLGRGQGDEEESSKQKSSTEVLAQGPNW